MSIKRFSYANMQAVLGEVEKKYAKKADLGTIAALNEIGESNLAADLKAIINGKANAADTLAGYGITDGMTATLKLQLQSLRLLQAQTTSAEPL